MMETRSLRSLALITMKRLSASEGTTVTRARARSMPARFRHASEVASPCSGTPCGVEKSTRDCSVSSTMTKGTAARESSWQTRRPIRP
jgi:hypothetical protein